MWHQLLIAIPQMAMRKLLRTDDSGGGQLVSTRAIMNLRLALKARDIGAEDVSQELLLRILVRWARFDPKRGSASSYASAMIRQASIELIRQARAKRRGASIRHLHLVEDDSGAFEPRRRAPDEQAATEQCLDVRAVLASQPAHVSRLARLLMHQGVAAAARTLGVSRSVALQRIAKLRVCFAAAGLAPLHSNYQPRQR